MIEVDGQGFIDGDGGLVGAGLCAGRPIRISVPVADGGCWRSVALSPSGEVAVEDVPQATEEDPDSGQPFCPSGRFKTTLAAPTGSREKGYSQGAEDPAPRR